MNLQVKHYIGPDIRQVMEPLARLRIRVFRDFPYLYAGTLEYEWEYLSTYAASPAAFLFAVYDQGEMVGATTCIPLTEETREVQACFRSAGIPLEQVCYFGESILLPAYRGQGWGHRFFDEREAWAARLPGITLMAFCAVDRPADHPLRPADYQPLDAFWKKRGYRKAPQLHTQFSWPDVGDALSTSKTMIYWLREMPPDPLAGATSA